MPADTIPPDRSPDRISSGKPLEPVVKNPSQPPATFESYMENAQGQAGRASQTSGTAPAAPMGGVNPPAMQTAGPTFDSLLVQAKTAQDGLGNIGQQLKTPNLKLKRSQSHLLKNKLQDANENIRSAGDRIQAQMPEQSGEVEASPVGRFLAYIGNGQDMLNAVQKKLQQISASNQEIRPADMLLVQIKMSQAQQEIEYSSTLLGKVIDSIKTLMNTQL